jgi:hypothetical protein
MIELLDVAFMYSVTGQLKRFASQKLRNKKNDQLDEVIQIIQD